ncbi:MAG: glycosyltransferase family 4 protein [Gemmatimonadota bacterium]|nr:glycosyltransferase family 4 protein [Gemmatimonadota bacterium]
MQSLCRQGETVHLFCQENHPERYDFIAAAHTHRTDGSSVTLFERETPYAGACILHKPELAGGLPVFVWDEYEEHKRVVPMIELSDEELEAYIACNVAVVDKVAAEFGIPAIHANHAVLMPVVAQRMKRARGVPFTIMPHGSDIEYAVKKDARFLRYAMEAIAECGRLFVIGDEMRSRVLSVFGAVPGLEEKLTELHLGVDTSQFEPVARSGRPERVEMLVDSLRGVSRGKTPEASAKLRDALTAWTPGQPLEKILGGASGYDAKQPDADVEEKLSRIDWNAPTVLFVGRLIAAKGIQSVIAALPAALEIMPDLQLIVVGHGPQRELMESYIYALAARREDLASEIIERGRELEGETGGRGFGEVRRFLMKRRADGTLESYYASAANSGFSRAVTFTGYLTHRELKHLFACCDVGIFPSVVREAGPLVFLEAIASGCFPMGTYVGGMAASIDAICENLPAETKRLMSIDPENPAEEIADKLPSAISQASTYSGELSAIARERYDWAAVGSKLSAALRLLSGGFH